MWIALNDAFLSIVHKDCPADSLLVRARRPGDIEKVFGRRVKVTRAEDADYLFRAVISRTDVEAALVAETRRITYPNFKSSVQADDLHDAYMACWTAIAKTQKPGPYSRAYVKQSVFAQQYGIGAPLDNGITMPPWKPPVELKKREHKKGKR